MGNGSTQGETGAGATAPVEPQAGGRVGGAVRQEGGKTMPLILWLLGVPGIVIIILLMMGVF